MAKKSTTIKRTLTIDPYAIMSLIKAQAGTIGKAMLEAVANSMDAGADRIDVTLDNKRIVITDNGRGLTKEQEIYDFFERFGFDHSNLDRKVGRFGVGRGQLFCFGVNTWRTNTFQMRIDIKKDGLDYDLDLDKARTQGMSITIDLYETLLASEKLSLEEEFRQLVRYCTLPVFLNGKQVSEDPSGLKWGFENADAWFKVRKDGRLAIYSQGLFVKEVWASEFGVGGTLITKPGKPLAQNLARNDILVKECDLWKAVQPVLRKLALQFKETSDKETITPDMRHMMAREASTPGHFDALLSEPLFTTSNYKHISLRKLIEHGFLAKANDRNMRADKIMQRKQAMVINESTLERFGVDSVGALQSKLIQIIEEQQASLSQNDYSHYRMGETLQALRRLNIQESVDDLPFEELLPFTEVKVQNLTPDEKVVLGALRRQMKWLGFEVLKAVMIDEENKHALYETLNHTKRWNRKLNVCEDGSGMLACTDGSATIWLNRVHMMQCARQGLPGFFKLIHLLTHEYLHVDGSAAAHSHPPEFYEQYHDALVHMDVANLAIASLGSTLRHGIEVTPRKLSELEAVAVEVDGPLALATPLEENGVLIPLKPAKPSKGTKGGKKNEKASTPVEWEPMAAMAEPVANKKAGTPKATGRRKAG